MCIRDRYNAPLHEEVHEFHRKVNQGQFLKCCFKPEFFIYFACWKSKKSIFNQFLERKFDWKYFFMKHFDSEKCVENQLK